MKKRLISIAVIVPVVVAALYFGGIFFQIAVLGVVAACIYEMTKALKAKEIYAMSVFDYAYAVIAAALIYFEVEYYIIPTLLILTMCVMSVPVITRKYSVKDALATVAVMVYPTTLILTLSITMGYSRFYTIGAIIASVIVDTAAYFFGNGMGKTKLCPEVSPHKTVAGAVGGAATCIVLLTVYGVILELLIFKNEFSFFKLFMWFDLAVLCSVFAQFGDLAASAVKRYCGIKDFSNLIPGHGGVLDRLDSVMFTSTLVYLFLVLGII